jgi:hypothetical protein
MCATLGVLVLPACNPSGGGQAAVAPQPGVTSGPPAVAAAPAASSPAASAAPAGGGATAPGAPPEASEPKGPQPAATLEPPTVELGPFVRELDQPVVSLALGEARAAALGTEPWLHEKGAWKKIAFPEKLRFSPEGREDGRIFFGRDDRPRIMGSRVRDGHPAQLYLRYRNERWNVERGEIAKLRDPPPQGMFGVLGHADPEVVCKVGDDCIIKRRTGWKMMGAGPGSPRVELHNGVAWALYPDSVARLEDDHRWVTVGAPAPFKAPGGVWALGDEVWISEPGADRVHHFRGGTWTSQPSPVAAPRGMWGTGRDDVWLAGGGGLAHFDGERWSRVAGPSGPLAEVHGRGGEVWAAGASGVWVRHATVGAKR